MLSFFQFLTFLSLFWFFHFLRRFCFWLYFWQLKEYRLDRFFDGIKENPKILWPKTSFFALFFLLTLPLSFRLHFFFESLVFGLYFIFFLYSLWLFLKKKWAFFIPTFKIVLLFLFSLTLLGWTLFYLNPTLSPFIFGIQFLVLEIFFPWIFLILFLIFQIPIFFVKKIIIFKAKKKRKLFKDLIVIGISGSYGKTSTKEFLSQILSQKYKVLKTEGNQNTEIGVARTILSKLNSKIDIFVCEMGAYCPGEIRAISNIALPQIGILTGITDQHISLFGSFFNLLNTEYELIASLPQNGIAIFNASNKYCLKLSQRTSVKKYFYSITEGPFDVFAKEIQVSADLLKFKVVAKNLNQVEEFSLNLFGKQNIENFLAGVAASLALGVSLKEIKKVEKEIKPSPTAINKKISKKGIIILDDSYSQNPIGTLAAIEYLQNYPSKKILIMPCLIELGKKSSFWHKKIGKALGKICDLAIITTPFYFEELKIGAMEEGMDLSRIIFLKEPAKILKKLRDFVQKGDVILLEGRTSEKLKWELLNI